MEIKLVDKTDSSKPAIAAYSSFRASGLSKPLREASLPARSVTGLALNSSNTETSLCISLSALLRISTAFSESTNENHMLALLRYGLKEVE